MSGYLAVLVVVLIFVVIFQIAKASEYVSILKGEKKSRQQSNKVNGFLMIVFLVVGLIGVYYCNELLKGKIGVESASVQGEGIDSMIKWTLVITGIVFVITQILLFWFAFKYQEKEGQKAFYFPHNNKLELIWTVIPAITLTILVAFGLRHWFRLTSDAPKDAMVVEVTGKQFNWLVRYPGKDGQLGRKFFKNINDANNPVGQDWDDQLNKDDFMTTDIHLVVNKPVKFIIGSRDVIHDVGLSAFRMKMDAVPGIPTTLWVTPKFTTKEMRQKMDNPDYVYELSCDQMCGKGHYSMKANIVVETQEEFDAWAAKQKAQFDLAHESATPAPAATAADSTQKAVAKN
ncbi:MULTISPECIES: cytochrome c oxidase subunit II [unclassified Chitinophaga]|uniref:cytochrome c oxidase subunit II n=1 Tax=unclassified Chitinophaga TaxID=2619133 RepID=UPI0009D4DF9E|nr:MULTISPECIES: cytochrome c oxidase subunit II [unclassified Chitinophaga]OMP78796.1 cytochrome C oxidase subunit II [[Flexibacter] sp. ATCC 35208]WPV68478.1 cytochrome c oxidase subunit II [Chitinophaga sp. LS1]